MSDENKLPSTHTFPSQLIMYPLEQRPLFPGMITQMIVNNKHLIKLIDLALAQHGYMGLMLLVDAERDNSYRFSNLFRVGALARIHKKLTLPNGGYNVFLSVLERFTITREVNILPPLVARVEYNEVVYEQNKELSAMMRNLIQETKKMIDNNPIFSEEARLSMINIDQPGQIADFVASILDLKKEEQQRILETFDIYRRMEIVLMYIKKEQDLLRIQKKIQKQINETVDKHRREHYLREVLKEIKKELGEPTDAKTSDYIKFKEKIETLNLPPQTREAVERELERFNMMETHNPEHGMLTNYLQTVVDLPWNEPDPVKIDIHKADRILERDHFGIKKVKERIIEHLAVSQIEHSKNKSILCLIGPPGVGKTSIAASVAHAMDRKMFHFSVGGMRDEAEIKGHRRTYIGAMPGKIIQGLIIVKQKNPVFVIDEIDKLSNSRMGDPSSALLEVLDPVQNTHFRDLYLDLAFDLSKIFFITTANSTASIPSPLLDRMELIYLSGYIDKEKIEIARKFLIPKSLKRHGVKRNSIRFDAEALKLIATQYSREAGMRRYEQNVDTIIRKLLTKVLKEGKARAINKRIEKAMPLKVDATTIKKYLGKPMFNNTIETIKGRVGVATGLAWTSAGGDVLVIESVYNKGPRGLNSTGTLGSVMKESIQIAFSFIKSYTLSQGIVDDKEENPFLDREFHIHVPSGAIPKEGPSAGITIATSLYSLITNTAMKPNFAMTGELSLTGYVHPIGGLREKIVAAKRHGVTRVIFPAENQVDFDEIPDYVKRGMKFFPVSQMDDVIRLLFPPFKPQTVKRKKQSTT